MAIGVAAVAVVAAVAYEGSRRPASDVALKPHSVPRVAAIESAPQTTTSTQTAPHTGTTTPTATTSQTATTTQPAPHSVASSPPSIARGATTQAHANARASVPPPAVRSTPRVAPRPSPARPASQPVAAKHAGVRPSSATASTPPASTRVEPNVNALTAVFRTQQAKVEACVAERRKDWGREGEIEIEFDLEPGPQLPRVAVQPRSFATTALGACIEGVARRTPFPQLTRRFSFAIPIRLHRAASP